MKKLIGYFRSGLRHVSKRGKPEGVRVSEDNSSSSRRGFLGATAAGLGAATLVFSRSGEALAQEEEEQPPPPAAIGYFNIKDYGAVGDGANDDSPAIIAAIDAASAAGGGTVFVPNGTFRIGSTIVKNFNAVSSKLVIKGLGTSSQLLIATGSSTAAFRFLNLLDLVIENIAFVGTPDVATDATRTIDLFTVDRAVLRDCQFYGISSEHNDGAIVAAEVSSLRIEQCAFLGSASKFNGVVYSDAWSGLKVVDTHFIDYGSLNGFHHSKTPGTVTTAWIKVGKPSGDFTAKQDQGEVFIRDVRMDEGSILGVYIDPTDTGARVGHVFISGLRVNGNGLYNSAGVHIRRASNVFIERSWVGYNRPDDGPHPAFYFVDAGDVVLEAVRCEQGFTTIFADAATTSLTIRNSIYETLNSESPTTIIIRNGSQISPPITLGPTALVGTAVIGNDLGSIIPPANGLVVQGRTALGASSANSTVQVGGSIGFKTRVVVESATLTDDDFFLIVAPRNRDVTITLPDPRPIAGRVYAIKRNGYGTGVITLARTGVGVEIDNAQVNYQMGAVYNAFIMLITNGFHWYIISRNP